MMLLHRNTHQVQFLNIDLHMDMIRIYPLFGYVISMGSQIHLFRYNRSSERYLLVVGDY